jgi:YidC/Oxa1 family membrane protein insertase
MTNMKQARNVDPAALQGMTSGLFKFVGVGALLAVIVWRWNDFIAIFVNIMLWTYHGLSHIPFIGASFGLAIILFTILTRVVTWPLASQQMKSTQAMQEMQNDKEWQDIQKKYAKDREKLAQEQMRIYKERGISPFSSCLPMLIQLPLWFAIIQALYRMLPTSPLSLLQLARSIYTWPERFLPSLSATSLIPINSHFLWMDLSRPEYTVILGFSIPLLVILVGVTSYFQMKLTTPPSTNPNDQSAQMSRTMSVTMPLMYIFMASSFTSGFALYLLTSNLLYIAQYAMMGKVNWSNLLPGGSQKTAPIRKR